MKELLLIPIIAMTLYLIYVYFRYGMTISISATAKVIKGFEKMWFTATLWAVAIPIIIVALENIPGDGVKILFFLAGALICLIAAAPIYWKGGMEYKAHMIGSYGGIGIGMIACLVHYWSLATVLLVAAFALFTAVQMFVKKYQVNNFIYWIEVAAIITVPLVLWLN